MATTTTGSDSNSSSTGGSSTGTSTAAARDALTNGVGQVKALAKKQPYAFAALAGVVGIALLNTLRGK